jgi:hypothetical protein
MLKKRIAILAASLGFILPVIGAPAAQAQWGGWGCWWCPPPPPPSLTEFASDDFNDGSLDWRLAGGGQIYIDAQGELSGVGTPSDPGSYAFHPTESPGQTQEVEATVRWNGRSPAHSATGLIVRADAERVGNTNGPLGAAGVQFSWTDSVMVIAYFDPSAPNGYRFAQGTWGLTRTAKFPEGSRVKFRAEGNVYTAYLDGRQILRGTVPTNHVPLTHNDVGVTIQDDSQVTHTDGGQPPGDLDDFVARSN